MRIGKLFVAAAALSLAGGSIAAQAQTVRASEPVSGESELGGLTFGTQFLVIALIAGVIAAGIAISDEDPQSP